MLNLIGVIYDNKNDSKKALSYYQNSLQVKQEIGDTAGIAISYNNIGMFIVI